METRAEDVWRTSALLSAGPIEALMGHVGQRDFALPLEDVDYIVELPPDFAHSGERAEKFLAFQGLPLSFVSSWDLTGEETRYSESAQLAAMLPQRRQDHIDWMSALEDSIRNGYAFGKARSPHECAFGKWYYSFRPAERQLALLLRNFEQPHAFIHGLADQLLKLTEAGKKEEALARFQAATDTTLKDLLLLFDRATSVLQSLQRRIAIILRRGEVRCALGADGVTDIVTIPPERVTRHLRGVNRQDEGSILLTLDNGKICPVMDWQRVWDALQRAVPKPDGIHDSKS